MRIKYTVGIFSHILFSKNKISNSKLCSYSSNETFRIVKYLSHYLKDMGFYYRHCNCISACPKWRNISLYLPSTLSYCCPPNSRLNYKQTISMFLFLFSWKILHFKSFSEHLLKVPLHAHNCSNLVGKMTCMGTLTWMFREMSQSPPILHWIIDEESKTLTKLEMEHWTRHKANYSS